MIRKAEAAYWQTSVEEASSPNEFWSLTNQVLRKHKAKNIGLNVGPNEEIITHDLSKAEYFNGGEVIVDEAEGRINYRLIEIENE